jgi:hypothetical protein
VTDAPLPGDPRNALIRKQAEQVAGQAVRIAQLAAPVLGEGFHV